MVFVPFLPVAPVFLGELEGLVGSLLAQLETTQLLVLADVDPELGDKDAGVDELVSGLTHGSTEFYQTINAVKTLTLPAEMGERVKVMLLAKSVPAETLVSMLPGFSTRDYRDRL